MTMTSDDQAFIESVQEQLATIKQFGIGEPAGEWQGSFLSEDIPRLLAIISRQEEQIESAEDNGWCFECNDYVGITSHYHCAKCGEVSSMFGHWVDGAFTCNPTATALQAEKEDAE